MLGVGLPRKTTRSGQSKKTLGKGTGWNWGADKVGLLLLILILLLLFDSLPPSLSFSLCLNSLSSQLRTNLYPATPFPKPTLPASQAAVPPK